MNSLDCSFNYHKRLVAANSDSSVFKLTDILFNELNSSTRLKHLRKLALNNILTNLIISYFNDRFLIISQNSNDYSGYRDFGLNYFTYRLIIGWVNLLLLNDYINLIPGYYDNVAESGKRARLTCSDKILSVVNSFTLETSDTEMINYYPSVILKNSEKQIVNYPFSGRIKSMIDFLNVYNEFISGADIYLPIGAKFLSNSISYHYPLSNEQYINIYHRIMATTDHRNNSAIPLLITIETNLLKNKKLQGQLYRVFNNGKFSEGGRFYGAEYQQLNEADRSKILIDNSPVTEIDYSSFHLQMLYHKTNKQYIGDPYIKIFNSPELRPLLKIVNLIAINSQNPVQALRAIKYEISKSNELTLLKRTYNIDEKDLLRKFESVHSRISQYFYSGIGIKLQHIDSQIAADILKHFTKREIPCLCVHDSFLVPQKHKEELKEVMNSVYKKHLGFDAKLKSNFENNKYGG